ncbi:MAG: GNAT family N-acetyltransferase [Proteobacteria bacterium]|nr:GNAT family N-acetyltransferase [Pseudomonadota bacterium]
MQARERCDLVKVPVLMAIEIKPFSAYPSADLYALFQDVYATSDGMSETFADKYPTLLDFEDDITSLQTLPGAIALAARDHSRLVAYLMIRPRRAMKLKHTAELTMGVAMSARGLGIGGAILRAGLERASAAGEIEIVYLLVRADNIPALCLYGKNGFQPLATLNRDTKIDGCYFDGILMRRFTDKY